MATITDQLGAVITDQLGADITDGISSPLSISGTPPAAAYNVPYSWTPTTAGGTTPYAFNVAQSLLPLGLRLNATTGEISGTPVDPDLSYLFAGGQTGGWWDTSSIEYFWEDTSRTIPAKVGGYVRGWTDRSPNGNHLVQTGANAPILRGTAPLTNQMLQSKALDTSPWAVGSATIAGNTTTAPDGTTTAETLTSTSTGAPNVWQSITMLASTQYTFSIFMKAGTSSKGYMQLNVDNPSLHAIAVDFDLVAGTAGASYDLIAGLTVNATGIREVGNGWYHCWVTITTAAGAFNGAMFVGPTTGSRTSVVGHTIHLWQGQVVVGASPGDIIQTTTAPVTYAPAHGGYYLEFNGVDQFYAIAFTLAQPFERVSALTHIGTGQIFGGNSMRGGELYPSGGTLRLYSGTELSGPAFSASTPYVVTERHNGSSSRIAIENGSYTTGDAGTADGDGLLVNIQTGGPAPGNTRHQGFLMIGRLLTDTEIAHVRAYHGAIQGRTL